MSVTGSWFLGARAFETGLAELKEWRDATSRSLASFRRWAQVSRLVDDQTALRIAHLERRLASERLTIAFVAEISRGKSELINALFFADLGARLLPAGVGRTTICPTEILHDPARPPSIRLLPIETRESPRSLREYLADAGAWKEIALDPERPADLESSFEVLSESMQVAAAEAANLGFAAEGGGRFEIPRWRYAVVNFPHPLLKSGLVILDTPGHNAFGAEPELTLNRIPDADAIVFMLAVDTGATRTDSALWNDHISPIGSEAHTRFIVLNKIDGLRDGLKNETQVLSEIDRQVRATAEALGVDPTRIYALSAKQGLTAKIQGDRDALMKSRLYRLEQALAQGLLHQRRVDHATAVRAETRSVLAEAKALLDSRHGFAAGQLEELASLQGKNQKLVETLARKAVSERARIEEARIAMVGLRAVQSRHADALSQLLDPNEARDLGLRARAAVLAASFSGSIGETLDAYFREARTRMQHAVEIISEVKRMMVTVSRKFNDDYGISAVETPEFGTERFLIELARLEEHVARDFKSTSSLLTRRRKTLGALFFDTVALQVIHVFEIADREVRAWMNAFVRPLESQLTAFQEQTNARIEGMGRIRNAETDLVSRVQELEAIIADVTRQLEEWQSHEERLDRLLDVARDPSLA